MADLQRLDAGRLDVAGLAARPSPCGCRRAARAPRRDRRGKPGADEAAVAAQTAAARRPVPAPASARDRRRMPRAAARYAPSASGRPMPPLAACEQPRTGARPPQARRGRRRGRAGRRAAGRGAPARARCRASCRSARAHVLAQRLVVGRSRTASSRAAIAARIAQRARRAAPPARARRRPVTVRSMAASRLPAARPTSSAAARDSRRVAASISRRSARPGSGAAAQARLLADLGQLDVLEQRADRGQLGAREGAERRPDRATPSCALSSALAGQAVERGGRHRRRCRAGDVRPIARRSASARQPSAAITSPGRQPHDLAGEVGRRHLADLELAGRDVERGERDRRPRPAGLRRLEQGGQVVARLASSRLSSVSVPGVTRRTTSRRTTALRAALPRLRRIFHLLADGDAEALRDQPLQVFVGAVDRHAAHRDVLAQVLAALGQHDAERLRGGHRVLEEQLVEVAHPVEQQAVGIGGLDLEELRHRRRHAGGIRAAATPSASGAGNRLAGRPAAALLPFASWRLGPCAAPPVLRPG